MYAVFEVKPEANEENTRYAMEKIGGVRNLRRTSRAMVASDRPMGPRELIHIIGGLLAKKSISEKGIRGHLETYDGVDMACAASAMTTFKRSSGEIEISDEREALPAFSYLLLDELHKLGTVAAIDIREYAALALESFRLEGDCHVD